MTHPAYYNEFDPYAAQWLRNLIAAGLIPAGVVDERSITEVSASDLNGFTQCHFFAGIGGWPLALRLAGWPDDRPVWTGSCPCQPFSAAGRQEGSADARHLWPEMFRLIKACRPEKVFGEQVASAEVVGSQLEASFVVAVQAGDYATANKLAKRLVASQSFGFDQRWVDGLSADLEAEDYAVRFEVLGAHSVGAPHIRQRLYWLADASFRAGEWESGSVFEAEEGGRGAGELDGHMPQRPSACGDPQPGRLADASATRCARRKDARAGCRHEGEGFWCREPQRSMPTGRLGLPIEQGPQGHAGHGDDGEQRQQPQNCIAGHWRNAIPILCRDGKYRFVPATESEVLGVVDGLSAGLGRVCPDRFPLAEKTPGRAGRLKGYGNAIVPQVAAEFILASESAIGGAA